MMVVDSRVLTTILERCDQKKEQKNTFLLLNINIKRRAFASTSRRMNCDEIKNCQ